VPKKVSSVSARDGASAATSTSSAPFPLLRSAMVAFEAAFKVSQALPPSISPRSASPAWRSAHNLEDETQRVVCDLYATEMLPEILGGIWKKTDSTVWIPSTGCGRRPVFSDYHELFDHPLQYRRRGAKGAATWQNWVIFGRPYNTFDQEGSVNPRHRDLAAHLAAQCAVGVWVRRDLSAWYPGWTALVVAARGVRAQDADALGFEALA